MINIFFIKKVDKTREVEEDGIRFDRIPESDELNYLFGA